jgi:hypothetical protein
MPDAVDQLIDKILAVDLPTLMNDTCFLLDVIRDPTRDTVKEANCAAAVTIAKAVTGPNPGIVSCVAAQVHLELAEHRVGIEQEAAKALSKAADRFRRMDANFRAFGGAGSTDMAHLHGHGAQTSRVLDPWLKASETVAQSADVPLRALDRVNLARTPARKGTQSMKDCVVVETYIDFARRARARGYARPIIFASSNTNDYCDLVGNHLKSDLAAEFQALQIDFASNFGLASYQLGLTN